MFGGWLFRAVRCGVPVAVSLALVVSVASADTFTATFVPTWDVNGSVTTSVRVGNSIFIGGGFSYLGPQTGSAAFTTQANSAPDTNFPTIAGGNVGWIVDDGSGGYYLGGTFTEVGGNAIARLAHIFGNGAVDPAFHPDPDGQVMGLVRSGTNLFVLANMTTIAGQSRAGIAAFDTSSGALTSWSPGAVTSIGSDTSLSAIGSKVYLCGSFEVNGAYPASQLVEFDTVGVGHITADLLPGRFLRFTASSGTTLYVGFSTAPYELALDTTTGTVTPWTPVGLTTMPEEIAVDGGTVFSVLTPITGVAIAATSAVTGAPLSSWAVPASDNFLGAVGGVAYTWELPPGGAGGAVVLARNETTGAVEPWSLTLEDQPAVVAAVDGHVVIGGAFFEAGGVFRQGFAELNASTGLPTAFAPTGGALGNVTAITASGNTVYVGGQFTTFDGQPRTGIAAFDASTDTLLPFAPTLGCSYCGSYPTEHPSATSLATAGGRVYFMGQYDSVDGVPHTLLAGVDGTTGAVLPFNPQPNITSIDAVVASNTAVYVGGTFASVGGATRSNLAALDPITGTATTWNPGTDDNVSALALGGNTLYLAGTFGHIGGVYRQYGLAAVSASTGVPTAWAPATTSQIRSLAIGGNVVFFAGTSGTLNGAPTDGIAAVDTASGATVPIPGIGSIPRVSTVSASADGSWVGYGLFGDTDYYYTPVATDRSGFAAFSLVDTPPTSGGGSSGGGGGGGGGTPGLAVSVTPDSQTVATGGTATFTVVASNSGGGYLSRIDVSDPSAPGCNRTSGDISALDQVAPGVTVSWTCSLVNISGSFANTVVASAPTDAGTITATATASVTVSAPPVPASPTLAQVPAKSVPAVLPASLVLTGLKTVHLDGKKTKLHLEVKLSKPSTLKLVLLNPTGHTVGHWTLKETTGSHALSLLLPLAARHRGRGKLHLNLTGSAETTSVYVTITG